MEWNYFTFRSVTYAQQGQRALEEKGIGARLQRAPRWMAEKGCSYALKLRAAEGQQAEEVLKNRQIPWNRRYEEKPGKGRGPV